MKVATGIIAIMLGILVIVQSCAISTLSAATENEAAFGAGATGVFSGFLLFIGGAFAFGLPLVAAIIFGVAGLLALLGINDFPDLKIWAGVCFVMATMAFFASRSDRKKLAATTTSVPPNRKDPT